MPDAAGVAAARVANAAASGSAPLPSGAPAAAPPSLARPSSPPAPLGAQPTLQESAPFCGADSYPSWSFWSVAAAPPTTNRSNHSRR